MSDLMEKWDAIRKYIADGGKGSWPRDWFEAEIDARDERIEELEAELREFSCPLGLENTSDICSAGSCLRCLSRRLKESQAENARLRAMQEWQPIETAPKDGREILAIMPIAESRPVFVRWYTSRHGIRKGMSYWAKRGGVQIYHPTRWMPLPEATQETDK